MSAEWLVSTDLCKCENEGKAQAVRMGFNRRVRATVRSWMWKLLSNCDQQQTSASGVGADWQRQECELRDWHAKSSMSSAEMELA